MRQYNFEQTRDFRMSPVYIVLYCSKSISYLDHKIWEIFPVKIKETISFKAFKKEIGKWVPQNFP